MSFVFAHAFRLCPRPRRCALGCPFHFSQSQVVDEVESSSNVGPRKQYEHLYRSVRLRFLTMGYLVYIEVNISLDESTPDRKPTSLLLVLVAVPVKVFRDAFFVCPVSAVVWSPLCSSNPKKGSLRDVMITEIIRVCLCVVPLTFLFNLYEGSLALNGLVDEPCGQTSCLPYYVRFRPLLLSGLVLIQPKNVSLESAWQSPRGDLRFVLSSLLLSCSSRTRVHSLSATFWTCHACPVCPVSAIYY